MAREKKTLINTITARVTLLYALFFIAGVAIAGMILLTQWGRNGRPLRELAREQMYRTEEVPYLRGTIYASNINNDSLTILACNSPFYNVYFDFGAIPEVDTIKNKKDKSIIEKIVPRREVLMQSRAAMIDTLAAVFPRYSRAVLTQSVDRVLNNVLTKARGYRYQKFVRDSVSQSQLDRLRSLPIIMQNGRILKSEKYQPRYRPFRSLARSVVGSDMWGTGIERAYNSYLSGVNGVQTKVRLYGSYYVPVKSRDNREVVNGNDVVTTLDVRMQDIVERALRNTMETSQGALGTGAIEGTAIVMSVSTGEIRAIANLTRGSGGTFSDERNHAITMRTEPGSTFKLVPLMALLEDGWDVNRIVDCGRGELTVPFRKEPVKDSHIVGRATIRRIFAESSNIGFIKMVQERFAHDPRKYVQFIRSLGIDAPFSMGLIGAANPIIPDPDEKNPNNYNFWHGLSLTSMAYGYGVQITPLHTLALYNAIANNGRMLEPLLVKEIRKDGRVVERFQARVINDHICSDRTLRLVQEYMQEVVNGAPRRVPENGNQEAHVTGAGACSDRYLVAGKTGTAQIAQPGVGYRDRNGGTYYLASFVGYFPADKPEYTVLVAVKTYYRAGVGAKMYGAQFGVPVFKAMADQIFSTFTRRETPLDSLKTPEAVVVKRSAPDVVAGVMPDVCGMGLRDALYLLEKLGMRVSVSGYGAIIEQYPPAGTAITIGEQATIKLNEVV